MRAKIFLVLSLLILGCGGGAPPLVTITQLDTKHNKANPFQITKYDLDQCKLVIEERPSFALLGPEMHGAFCLSAEDFAKYKAHFQAECRRQNERVTHEGP
jgi:hypothetical protein